MLGFDPAGAQKFSVSSPLPAQAQWAFPRGIIVAGDGNAYVPYSYSDYAPYPPYQMNYLKLLRVSSDGASEKIDVFEWSSSHNPDGPMIGDVKMITNADEGAVLAFEAPPTSADWSDWQPHLGTISGSTASVVTPGGGFHTVTPMLQLECGSFIGTADRLNDYGRTDR